MELDDPNALIPVQPAFSIQPGDIFVNAGKYLCRVVLAVQGADVHYSSLGWPDLEGMGRGQCQRGRLRVWVKYKVDTRAVQRNIPVRTMIQMYNDIVEREAQHKEMVEMLDDYDIDPESLREMLEQEYVPRYQPPDLDNLIRTRAIELEEADDSPA